MVALRLIVSSLRFQKALYALWIFSLSAAVTGLIIIDVYRRSLTQTLDLQGRKILTADVALSSRRNLSDNEKARFRSLAVDAHGITQLNELFAMVTASSGSRLAMVRFIDNDFPLVGELEVEQEGAISIEAYRGRDLASEPVAWVAQDLLSLMSVKLGDSLQVGELRFKIAGVIRKDSSQTFRMGNMAPRLYVHLKYLPKTKLVQFGSTFSETLYAAFEIPPLGLKKKFEVAFPETGFNVTVPTDLEQGSLRAISGLMDYLGLIGLVTLSLGWIGVYYLGRRWLTLEQHSTGILKALGFTSAEVRARLLLKLTLILSLGVVLGGVISWFGAHSVFPSFQSSLPSDFKLIWSWKNTLLLVAVGPLAGLLLLLYPLHLVAFEKPLSLLGGTPSRRHSLVALAMLMILTALLFFALTWLQARSWIVTGSFLAGLVVTVLLVAGMATLIFRQMRRWRLRYSRWSWHLASAIWTRRWTSAVLLVSVSALSGLLAQMIPHVEKTLVGELQSPSQLERPALFLFDIQEEQIEPLKRFLAENDLKVSQSSPFIRGRILTVNGQNFERGQVSDWSTREEELEARFRNRGVNLSFRGQLSPPEKIIEGLPWAEHTSNPALISVEERYAQRVGLKMGDTVRFDVQGVEVEAKVASIREINWNSFQPNFFIQFPEGVLEGAPKTWIMTIDRHPKLTAPEIQTRITRQFANVSSVNVQEALDNATDLIEKLSAGLKLASRLSLALGIFVFVMILMFQLMSSQRDWSQLRVQGLSTVELWKLQLLTYGGLGVLGTVFGAIMALAVAWGVSRFGFKTRVHFDVAGALRVLVTLWVLLFAGITWLGLRQFLGWNTRRDQVNFES